MNQDVSVFEAVKLWFAGDTPKNLTMWGHPLVFWDRLGQVMEFVGALAVVIDLLGAERLSAIAGELREWTRDPEMRPTNLLVRPRAALIGIAAISFVAGFSMLTGSQKIEPVLPFTSIPIPAAVAFAVTILGLAIPAYLLLVLYFALFCVVIPPLADYIARILQREHADK